MKYKAFFFASVVCGSSFLTGCIDPNNPNWNSGPSYGTPYGTGYSDPYYNNNSGYYENERERDRLRDARRDAERERERLERDRERLAEERARAERNRYEAPPPPRREERCPSGFSPSENKCSNEERRRGCKDMRLPGGLGCVRR